MSLKRDDKKKVYEKYTNNVDEAIRWIGEKDTKICKGLELQLNVIIALQLKQYSVISWKPRPSKLTKL